MINRYMPDIISIILPTFFVIFVGFMVGKFFKVNMVPLIDVNLYLGVPALAFTSLISKNIVLLDAAKVWLAAAVIMFGCLIVAWLVFKALRQKHSGLLVPIFIMNSVNIPFPILSRAYGDAGLAVATLFYVPDTIITYTVGIYLMAGQKWKENAKEMLRQPAIYAALLGLAFNLLKIPVPGVINNSLTLLSQMCLPLILIVLGYNLSHVRITSIPTTLLASFLRIGVGLGIGIAIAGALHMTGVFRSVVIFDAAMPAAATAAILAAKYNNEAEEVSSVVFLTTVISLIFIPFLLKYIV
jgi:malate permease and related proteins